jgi:hypothetical protein
MKSSKKSSTSVTPYIFTQEEIERLKNQHELQTIRTEIIGLLDSYSANFADWSIIISEAVHERMTQKQQCGMDCEKERKMLDSLSFLFIKLAFHSCMLSDWHNQLTLGNELTAKMIEEGHP